MTTEPLIVAEHPCSSCPYRRDVPSGIWAREEYEKLRAYDDNNVFGVFLCHHSPSMDRDAVCRGWLVVHADSVAVRLAVCQGIIRREDYGRPCDTPLYKTGNAAANAGIKGIKRPGIKARRAIDKLIAKRAKD